MTVTFVPGQTLPAAQLNAAFAEKMDAASYSPASFLSATGGAGAVVYVQDHGAVGDGVTDDTAALQAALNAVAAHGGSVSIGRLRLYINGAISLPNSVRLTGDFRHVQINYNSAQDWYNYGAQICLGPVGSLTMANASASIDHIMFIRAGLYTSLPLTPTDATALVAAFAGTAVTLNSAADVLISECMFLGFTMAINAPIASRLNVIDCLFDCTNGMFVGQCYDVSRFERLHFWPLMTGAITGLGVAPLAYLPLQRSGTAMKWDNSDNWAQVINCFEYGYTVGFWVDGGSNCTFVACHCDYTNPSDNSEAGFKFTSTTGIPKLIGCFSVGAKVGVSVNTSGPQLATLEIIGGNFANTVRNIDVVNGGCLIHGATLQSATEAVSYGAGTTVGAVVGCNFNGGAGIIYANAAIQRLVTVVANASTGGVPAISDQTSNGLVCWGPVTLTGINTVSPPYRIATVGSGTDQNIWDWFASGNTMAFRTVNDAYTVANTWLAVSRVGDAPQTINLQAGAIYLSGDLTVTGRSGFNNTAPISKPTGVAVTAEAIHAALVSYGLIAGP